MTAGKNIFASILLTMMNMKSEVLTFQHREANIFLKTPSFNEAFKNNS